MSRILETLAHEKRLRIVALLSHAPVWVGHLQAALGLAPAKAARHLGILRSAGLVESRNEGGIVLYELAQQPDPLCRKLVAALISSFDNRALLRRDAERMLSVKAKEASQ